MNGTLTMLLLHYMKQPSTWQGLTLLVGSVAAWLGVPAEMVTAAGVLVLGLILIIKDERPASAVIEDVVGKVLADKVDKK